MLKVFIYSVWVISWIYWIYEASKSKRTLSFRIKRGIFFRVLILLFVIVVIAALKSNVVISEPHTLPLKIIGTILFILGVYLSVWARRYIGINWGMPMSLKENPELITTGPYKHIRHPIYSGIMLATLGTALAVNYWWLILLLLAGSYFIYSAFTEEKDMKKQFPHKYEDYIKSSKMLIPYIF